MSNLKRNFLVIGHDATRTGAPTSLLNFVKWMKLYSNYIPIIVLADGGDLVSSYAEQGEVIIWKESVFKSYSFKYRVLGKIYTWLNLPKKDWNRINFYNYLRSKEFVFCFNNTIVNGHLLEEILNEIPIPVISRIPELEATIRFHNLSKLASKTFALSNHFVAVSEAVKNNLIKNHQIPSNKISVVNGGVSQRQIASSKIDIRMKFNLSPETILVAVVEHWIGEREVICLFK